MIRHARAVVILSAAFALTLALAEFLRPLLACTAGCSEAAR